MFQLGAVMLFQVRHCLVQVCYQYTLPLCMRFWLQGTHWGFLVLAASMIWHSHITNYTGVPDGFFIYVCSILICLDGSL